jgi:hypothetical protein
MVEGRTVKTIQMIWLQFLAIPIAPHVLPRLSLRLRQPDTASFLYRLKSFQVEYSENEGRFFFFFLFCFFNVVLGFELRVSRLSHSPAKVDS